MNHDPAPVSDLQGQIDALSRRVADNRADIDALEAQARVDRELVAELQLEGVLSKEHAEQLEQALKSSRTIGAAIGMIMASRHVREDEAFTILKKASQNSNRKLRDLAQELVVSGAVASLP